MSRTGKRGTGGVTHGSIAPCDGKYVVNYKLAGSTAVFAHEEPTREQAETWLAGLLAESRGDRAKKGT